MAAVSRCRSLLLGVVELDRVGRSDIIGVPLRALLEVWYFGILAVLGEDEDLESLEADHRFWKNQVAKAMSGVAKEPGNQKKFSVRQRAKRADELLAEKLGESPGIALAWYHTYYAAESLLNAHAGMSSLGRYIEEHPDGNVGIVHEPDADEDLRYGQIRFATFLVALLAKWTWTSVGLDPSQFDEIEGIGRP